jgi:hypothetical protein
MEQRCRASYALILFLSPMDLRYNLVSASAARVFKSISYQEDKGCGMEGYTQVAGLLVGGNIGSSIPKN